MPHTWALLTSSEGHSDVLSDVAIPKDTTNYTINHLQNPPKGAIGHVRAAI